MKIQCKVIPYELPIALPPYQRRGLLIALQSDEGGVGWGEIAPLAGWSKEGTAEAVDQLQALSSGKLRDGRQVFPSVAFGLESAYLNLTKPVPDFSVPINALLMGSTEEILKKAKAAKARGCKTAKLKVGSLSLNEAYALIEELRRHFLLRIDVNKAWSLKQALAFFSRFPQDAFEYIEDPIDNPAELSQFPYPIALDGAFDPSLPHLKAIVLKPTLLGLSIFSLIRQAKERGVKVILSGAFESGVGILQIAQMAYRLNLLSHPIGLDTYSYLHDDLLEKPLAISEGKLHCPATITLKERYGLSDRKPS